VDPSVSHQTIIVLDFGSQYTQLIARRLRELSVYSEIRPPTTPIEKLRERRPIGIILSGGPKSVSEEAAPKCDPGVFDIGVPVLGICYGMQLMAHTLGGKVEPAPQREYGHATVTIAGDCAGSERTRPTSERTRATSERTRAATGERRAGPFGPAESGGTTTAVANAAALFVDVPPQIRVWASHGDLVAAAPRGFSVVATSANAPIAAMSDPTRALYAILFHPEVVHTESGLDILRNFAYGVCGCTGDWTMASFVEEATAKIRAQVGGGRIVCALSGGVDSTVAALILHRAVGDRLTCIFVDNGVLRLNESAQVRKRFERLQLPLVFVDASAIFLERLKGVTDPEQKRKIIGATFIDVFEAEAAKLGSVDFLAQGTLYPDVIESVSIVGQSAVIKSHHNVGGLPERMRMKLVEPLRELFKDEVREVGRQLGLDNEFVVRQPFPGPGLAVRILGEVTVSRLDLLRRADAIVVEEVKRADWYARLWQSFAVLLPVQSVGVMGDARTYEYTIAVRAVESRDGMTADWARLPHDLLARISSRIVNEVKGINRVVYDISSKPPSTIEWE
jgi:GMP synthase (glutamine-hydrolysing)